MSLRILETGESVGVVWVKAEWVGLDKREMWYLAIGLLGMVESTLNLSLSKTIVLAERKAVRTSCRWNVVSVRAE